MISRIAIEKMLGITNFQFYLLFFVILGLISFGYAFLQSFANNDYEKEYNKKLYLSALRLLIILTTIIILSDKIPKQINSHIIQIAISVLEVLVFFGGVYLIIFAALGALFLIITIVVLIIDLLSGILFE